ncbi:MAG: hypothetical protein UX09_C0028G0006 [Candidatus Uhrbacteria bacterium GW2011_GWE2_45_35]|uniref:YdbS-like PH domain-containing protein n=2 Tax=Candidatus Uhriibacteriota TaxID=1752732 RepID=A0A0G1J9C6_9BACT|nr:MAG: hypothetical protein UW63_C0084G0004 [Candidatus Uhrbacteria bacterium GW2011_GWF2_44_350]KKU07526.1 MAG: hypothetical protein UX09_C0028G0006 [Candidatus Uhrbacteria bacterium GW2011_GWE2_45_35]HBR80152.1 hypothetical protein [Candidatus Uhrbacteria bacterium]HCU31341.1 hypothetical protein [Candidatus Uhrbacteria bacterium]
MKTENLIQLRPGEQVLDTVNEDIIPSLPWLVFLIFWIVGPFFFLFPLVRQGPAGIILLVVLVGSGIFMAWRFRFSRLRTVLIVTDQRIVDIVQHGFSDRTISEVNHEEIEEVTYRVKGLLATIFRFGTVIIRTAGERADIAACRVHRPIDLHHLLNDLRQETLADPAIVLRAQKLKTLAEQMSDQEVERLTEAIKKRESSKAAGQFFQE